MHELTIRCGSCRQPRTLRVGQLVVCRLVSNDEMPGTITSIDPGTGPGDETVTAVFPGHRPVTSSPTWFSPASAADPGRHAGGLDHDVALALDALEVAAEYRRYRARQNRRHFTPGEPVPDQDQIRAREYDALADRIREQTS